MSADLVIGLDVGTSGARAVLLTADARILAVAQRTYPLHTPGPGRAEHDPDQVATAALDALGEVARSRPAGASIAVIGVSTIFHSLLAVNSQGVPIGRSMSWADTRARHQVERLARQADPELLYRRTGCPLHPMYLPAKILWLREVATEAFTRAALFGSLKDEILFRLTGQRVIDRSVASATGLLDLERGTWHEPLLEVIGIGADQLPPIVEPTDIVGGLTPAVASLTSLPAGTPIVAGAGDGVLSSLGAGAVAPGQMTVMIGTSGAARLAVDRPVFDAQARTWCYYLAAGRWIAGAAINNGGLACQWVRDNLLPRRAVEGNESDFETIEAEARRAPPGAGGIVFLPFLTGERSPYWNANARGVIFGLAAHHGPHHVARSVFEGVCFRMRSIVDALNEAAGPAREYRATGGFTRSTFWLQMLADVLGQPLILPRIEEASAVGAAALAALGTGLVPSLDDIAARVAVDAGPSPDPAHRAVYDRLFRLYMDIYWANQEAFARIAEIQEDLG